MSEPDVSDLLTVPQAIAILDAVQVDAPGVVAVSLEEADGRVLAEPVRADRDYPPFDKSQMDGFAVRAADVGSAGVELHVVGEIAAGQTSACGLAAHQAIAIMTGAPLPEGADAVVPVEDTARVGQNVRIGHRAVAGKFIARRGSDMRAGEVVLEAGMRLNAAALAVIASVGTGSSGGVRCYAKPRVAVMTTGDELMRVEQTPGPAQIRDSNGIMIASLLRRMGCETIDGGIIPDDPKKIREALDQATSTFPLTFVSGGMSMGEYDYVPKILGELGVELRITKLRIKPGKPFIFGQRGHGGQGGDHFVFGLPGNPVSGFVCTVRLASRLVARLCGAGVHEKWVEAAVSEALPANGPREFYQPAILLDSLEVRPLGWKGSADIFTLARANALLVRGENEPALQAGSRVRVLEI